MNNDNDNEFSLSRVEPEEPVELLLYLTLARDMENPRRVVLLDRAPHVFGSGPLPQFVEEEFAAVEQILASYLRNNWPYTSDLQTLDSASFLQGPQSSANQYSRRLRRGRTNRRN